MMKNSPSTKVGAALVALALITPTVRSGDVPAMLPIPDGKPGDASKPVKVYILAGQSNMVGMGDLRGAKNVYDGVFYSSDPAVPNAPLPVYRVGNYKTSPLSVYLPDGKKTDKPIAEGQFEVSRSGVYQLSCGFGASSRAVMLLDGEEGHPRYAAGKVIRQEVKLAAGKRYSFAIKDFKGEPFWMRKMDLLGNGDLEAVAKREGKFSWLVDAAGEWSVRQDVYFQEARLAKDGSGSLLSATSNGKSIGPELGFGHVLGTFHDEPVLLIKTAQGNRSLGFDFRPPSSGRTDPSNEFESAEYKLMVEGVRKTLANLDKIMPGYKGQGYEMAGFLWFQGHKDSFSEKLIAEYEKNLVHLINDFRKEFKTPKLPAVVATVGFGGHRMQEKFLRIHKAQMAVGAPEKHPEYNGNVASVDTRPFWREVDESPTNQDYHYHRNAETYLRIGDALGRAMVRLKGGKAGPLPQPARPKRSVPGQNAELTDAEKAAARQALRPILIDGIAAGYVANPRYKTALLQEHSGEPPNRATQFLRGATFGLVNCYQAAGIDDYDWKPFGPDLDKVQWEYHSFEPKESLPKEKYPRYRAVTYPAGMDQWFAPAFDVKSAGWKAGQQPFGQLDGKLAPLSESCPATFCGCGHAPKTLWEKEVLLMRATVEVPPLKSGHRYRVLVGGSAHVNSGDGFALYVNGKLIAESKLGVHVRQGGQPRGAYVYNDAKKLFHGGKVTLAVKSFLRYNHPRHGVQPPKGHISLKLEEMKLPPLK